MRTRYQKHRVSQSQLIRSPTRKTAAESSDRMPGSFELRYISEEKGVGLFATQPYEANQIIFEERPLVAAQYSWNEAYGYAACHHCLRPMESTEENLRRLTGNQSLVVPAPELCPTNKFKHVFCDSCGVGFCSESCKVIAVRQYHKFLCTAEKPALIDLIEVWKKMHYPPETTSIMLVAKIIATIECAEDKDFIIKTLLEFSHDASKDNGDMCMKILGSQHLENVKILQQKLIDVLRPQHSLQFLGGEKGLVNTLTLIGRNGQGIGTSVFSKWIKAVEESDMSPTQKEAIDAFIDSAYEALDQNVGTFLDSEGSGLYKLQRCVNHSCSPNAAVTFPYSESLLVLETKKPIAAGEEICVSYLDECVLDHSRHTRKNALREYYLFDCSCDKCLMDCDEPDVTSEESGDEGDPDWEMED